MGVVVSIRQESAVAQESEVTVRYCISLKVLNAKELLNASRSHLIGHLVKMFAVNVGGRKCREFCKEQTNVLKHAEK